MNVTDGQQPASTLVDVFSAEVCASLAESSSIVDASYLTTTKLIADESWQMSAEELFACVLCLTVRIYARQQYPASNAQASFEDGFYRFVDLNGTDIDPLAEHHKTAWKAGRKANPKYAIHRSAKLVSDRAVTARFGSSNAGAPEIELYRRTKYWAERELIESMQSRG